MEGFDFMSSEHFHVILHPDKKHGLIFNRLDNTFSTINYDDAKELCNLKKIGRVYGIIGRYLNKYLVLIKNRALVGSLYDPNTKTDHKVYVITQVQVADVSCIPLNTESSLNASSRSSLSRSVRYDVETSNVREEADQNLTSSTTSSSFTYKQEPTAFINTDPPVIDHVEDFSSLPVTISTSSYASMQSRGNAWNPFRLANSFRPRMPTQFLKSTINTESSIIDSSKSGESSQGKTTSNNTHLNDESDKRLVEEMTKLFNNTNSFYFSPTLDLTNRFSRKAIVKTTDNQAMWKTADKRFFWNRHMLKDLMELSENDMDANYFICVILQGFIAIEQVVASNKFSLNEEPEIEDGIVATPTSYPTNSNQENTSQNFSVYEEKPTSLSTSNHQSNQYQLALVSRRSVFQAGTRYRRRGCDNQGNCANFVETEQIFRYNHHFTSLVLVRGSIPLFWYQTGYNYRPPPVLFKSEEENHLAFTKHFENLIQSYDSDQVISIDCTEHTGREKSLHDAFKKHMEKLRASYPSLKHIEFDFHKHCRGRQCSFSQIERHLKACGLTDELIKGVRYYWNDGEVVWSQDGVFRVNCLDCSDRTNVVQRAIALQILDTQLARLGVIAPDTSHEENECRKLMQVMWSTNGNVLSTQYCGTRALFSEDAKLSGYLKDTYSSASRYYISKFRDVYRQAAIDAMLGVESAEKNLRSMDQSGQGSCMDQYELISLEPILSGRVSASGGSALLKDVGNRVSNRLARLKGKFYVKPHGLVSNPALSREDVADGMIDETEPELIETTATEALNEMNIDWPSTESVNNNNNASNSNKQSNNIFSQLSHSDDSFQDDEFGQLMLSIDLTELQRLRNYEERNKGNGESSESNKEKKICEEIHMTEACGILTNTLNSSNKTASRTSDNVAQTSTTST